MKRGGFSYRVKLEGGRSVNLGWNLDEALVLYRTLRPFDGAPADEWRTVANELFVRHRKGAKARSMEFTITVEDIARLLRLAGGKCQLTGRKFTTEKPKGVRIRPYMPSLDRLDAMKGYVPGNVRVVCGFVNVALNAFGDAMFIELLEAIVRREVRNQIASLPR